MAMKLGKVLNAKFDVEKFDGKINFRFWQFEVLDILVHQGLHKVLEGKDGKPQDMSDEEWEDCDRQASYTIRLYLVKEIISVVAKEKSAASIWTKLESLYLTKPLHNRLYLKMQLFKFKMQKGVSIIDHINEFDRLIVDLMDMEVVLEDEDKATILLISLPNKYDDLVTTLVYGKETIRYDEVSAALLAHASRRKFANLNLDSQGEDLVVRGRTEHRSKGNGKSRSKSQSKKNLVCYYCRKKGHFIAECPDHKSKGKERKY